MFEHFKYDGAWYKLQFYPIFLIRRLVFVISLVALQHIPELQCNIFICSSLGTVAYLCISQPFIHKVNNILMIINEISVVIISILQIIFLTNYKTVEVINFTGWVMISVNCVNILINFAISITLNVKEKLIKCFKPKPTPIQNSSGLFDLNRGTLVEEGTHQSQNGIMVQRNSPRFRDEAMRF